MKKNKIEKWTDLSRALLCFTILSIIFIIDIHAQGGGATQGKLSALYVWVNRIVNGVLLIFTAVKLVQIIMKAFFTYREFGMDIAYAVIGIVIWGIWASLGNDLLQLLGVGGVKLSN